MEHVTKQQEPDLKPAERDVQRIKLHVNTASEWGLKQGSRSLFIRLDDLILSWSHYNKFMFCSKNDRPTPGFNLFTSLCPPFTPSPSVHSLRALYKNEGRVENESLFLEMKGSSESGSAIFQPLDCFSPPPTPIWFLSLASEGAAIKLALNNRVLLGGRDFCFPKVSRAFKWARLFSASFMISSAAACLDAITILYYFIKGHNAANTRTPLYKFPLPSFALQSKPCASLALYMEENEAIIGWYKGFDLRPWPSQFVKQDACWESVRNDYDWTSAQRSKNARPSRLDERHNSLVFQLKTCKFFLNGLILSVISRQTLLFFCFIRVPYIFIEFTQLFSQHLPSVRKLLPTSLKALSHSNLIAA